MDDGNKEDWEDRDKRNNSKSRCGNYKKKTIREAIMTLLWYVERKTEEDVVMGARKMKVSG